MYSLQSKQFRGGEGLFGLLDGGRSPHTASLLNKMLEDIVEKELLLIEGSEKDNQHLVYLRHAFLTAHRWVSHNTQQQSSTNTRSLMSIFNATLKPEETAWFFHNYSIYRRLGETGQKYGSSVTMCHLRKNSKNGDSYTLNVANTGLGEAILCSGRSIETIASAHNPATNREEVKRIVDKGGYVSEVS